MGLRTWWLSSQINRNDRKLKTLRYKQKETRERVDELEALKKKGKAPADYAQKQKKLHDQREQLTHQVAELMAQEERLKNELDAAEQGQQTVA